MENIYILVIAVLVLAYINNSREYFKKTTKPKPSKPKPKPSKPKPKPSASSDKNKLNLYDKVTGQSA